MGLYPIGATENICKQVLDILDNIIKKNPKDKKLKVLDAAAGNGYLTKKLVDLGFEVIPVDINTMQWALTEVPCVKHDLNEPLDFEEDSFDLVISVETIEHLENPFAFIRNISRVLKKEGITIITTPNTHCAQSRLKYLFLGYPTFFEYTKDDKLGGHIMPVNIGIFLHAFKQSNLKLLEIFSTGPQISLWKKLFIYKLLNLFVGIRNYLFETNKIRGNDYYLFCLSKKQLKHLNDGPILIIVAQKI